MGPTITPVRTMLRRTLGHCLALRNDYLKGLSRFSTKLLLDKLLPANGKNKKSVTTEEIYKWGFTEIAKILEEKEIKSIEFVVDNRTVLCRRKSYEKLIASALRLGIRHLATYGIQNNVQRGLISCPQGPDDSSGILITNKRILSDITIKATERFCVTVTFEIFEPRNIKHI